MSSGNETVLVSISQALMSTVNIFSFDAYSVTVVPSLNCIETLTFTRVLCLLSTEGRSYIVSYPSLLTIGSARRVLS